MRIQTVAINLVLCGVPLAGCGGGGASSGGGGNAGSASSAQAGMGGATSTSSGGSSSGSSGSGGTAQSCGADQVSCNGVCLGAGMSQTGCSVLAAAGKNVEISFGLALDDGYVYWPEQGTRAAIARVAKTGGARQQLTTTTDAPLAVAVNSSNVFWTEVAFATSSIQMVPKAGGTAQALYMGSEADSTLNNAVATETRVYVSRSHFGTGMASDAISVGFAQKDLLVHGLSGGDGSEISGFSLALDASSVYWLSNTDFTGGQVLRSSLLGMEGQVLASPSTVAGLVALNGLAYFVSGNTIQSVPIAGGTPATVFSSADVSGAVFAGSGTSLYFGSASALWRVGTDGSNPTRLLTTSGSLTFAVADSTGVYASIVVGGVFGEGFIVKAGG